MRIIWKVKRTNEASKNKHDVYLPYKYHTCINAYQAMIMKKPVAQENAASDKRGILIVGYWSESKDGPEGKQPS